MAEKKVKTVQLAEIFMISFFKNAPRKKQQHDEEKKCKQGIPEIVEKK